jgi:uncharacterized membrane protein
MRTGVPSEPTVSSNRRMIAAGILLGLGLGGYFDGIVLHQILQWHHMVSHVGRYPTTTVAGLEANTLADGLFHAATYVFTVAGFIVLWQTFKDPQLQWSGRAFVGLLLVGWGLFNLVEGIIDHHLLQIHHVKENSAHRTAWDLEFLAWGALMVVGGWWLARRETWTRQAGP